MSNFFTDCRCWVEGSIIEEKVKLEMMYAINWMEINVAIIEKGIFKRNSHPGIAFF